MLPIGSAWKYAIHIEKSFENITPKFYRSELASANALLNWWKFSCQKNTKISCKILMMHGINNPTSILKIYSTPSCNKPLA